MLRIALVALSAASSIALAAPEQYWTCIDAQGVTGAQDRPCGPDQRTVSAPASPRIKDPDRPSIPLRTEPKPVAARTAPPKDTGSGIRRILTITVLATLFLLVAAGAVKQRTRSRTLRREPPSISDRDHPPVLPAAPPKQWSIELLHALEWKRFEELCEGVCNAEGLSARMTGPGADGGIDLVISDPTRPDRLSAVAQCKAWNRPVGVETVRALWGSRDHFKAEQAIFYSLSGFTSDAQAFREGKELLLVSGSELLAHVLALPHEEGVNLLEHVTRGDYTTPSCPKCEIKMIRKHGTDRKPDFWTCPQFASCRTRAMPVGTKVVR